MDKSSVKWSGPMVALATPFTADGAIDEAAFRANIDLCIGYGVTGLLVSGCTGESWALTAEERKRLALICVQQAGGKATVLAGTGAIRTEDVIALTKDAEAAGCDGVVITPPFFVKVSADDIAAHYEDISQATRIPMMLYNIPSYATNELTPELVARLARIENVVAIKESSGDFNKFYRTLALCRDSIHVFVGPAALFGVPALLMGCSGYIDTIPNLWGSESVELHDAAKTGNLKRARILQDKAAFLRDLLNRNGRNYYSSLKAAMNMLGLPGGYPRRPLRPLREPQLIEIATGLRQLGFSLNQAAE